MNFYANRLTETCWSEVSHFRDSRVSHVLQFSAYVRCMTTTTKETARDRSGRTSAVATPWGKAFALERVTVPQRAGDKRFSSIVELLETERGERLVRLAYTTDGVVRRGPVTLRERDLARLVSALASTEQLAELFPLGGVA